RIGQLENVDVTVVIEVGADDAASGIPCRETEHIRSILVTARIIHHEQTAGVVVVSVAVGQEKLRETIRMINIEVRVVVDIDKAGSPTEGSIGDPESRGVVLEADVAADIGEQSIAVRRDDSGAGPPDA